MRRGRWIVALALAGLVLPTAADAARTRQIAQLPNESFLRVHDGNLLVAVRAAEGHTLALVRRGRVEPLPIAPSPHPIEADVGSDHQGRPVVVLSRCRDGDRRDCDLFLHRIGQEGELPIRAANSSASETAPTVWRGRIAWVRSDAGRDPVVLTRLLRSRRTTASRRLAGVPTRRCDLRQEATQSCELRERRVESLELYGDRLALDVTYVAEGGSGHWQREIRLSDLRGGSRRVASGNTGEGGQDFLGISFARGRLGWHQSCFGDPSCGRRAYRFRPSTGDYEVATGRSFSGFALTAHGFMGIDGGAELGAEDPAQCDDPRTTAAETACPLLSVTDVGWRRVEARRIRD